VTKLLGVIQVVCHELLAIAAKEDMERGKPDADSFSQQTC
jgi:hypothetical protein